MCNRKFIFSQILFILLIIVFALSGCELNNPHDIVVFKGQVVYSSNNQPFPDLPVMITDGINIHVQDKTDNNGYFSLPVKKSQVNGDYYLLVGDETCVPKRVELVGWGHEEVDLKVIPVDGPTIPSISKFEIEEVTSKTIRVSVLISDDGRKEVTKRGVCWSEYEKPTTEDSHTNEGRGDGTFVSTISDLKASTTYYLRAYATNERGTTYSSQIQVETFDGAPILDKTIRVLANSANSVTCYGSIKSDGGFSITSQGFCWSTHQEPTIYDQHTIETPYIGEFCSVINNLAQNTTYYFRAYATNHEGTSYSEQTAYELGATQIKLELLSAQLTRADIVECQVKIADDGGFAITERGVCWSTYENPIVADNHVKCGNGVGSFSCTLTGLPFGSIIYVRAYATNISGTAYSNQVTIMTGGGVPTFTTPVVSNITSNSATATVSITDDGGLPVLARGFCWTIMSWAMFATLEEADGYTSNGAGTGSFTGSLYPLNPNYTYYVCPYVTNAAGTFYGELISFKTRAQ